MNSKLSEEEFQRRVNILKSQDFYLGESYYPDMKSKSDGERFADLVCQIKEYGWPDFQYLQYGMDVKTKEECDKYVNAMEFVYRRNYLNFERNTFNNECCILRNKLFFEIFSRNLGIKTPIIEAYYSENKLYSLSDGFSEVKIEDFISQEDRVLFCKELAGECGVGVFKIEIRNGKMYISNEELSIEGLVEIIYNKEFIFQKEVRQHAVLNSLYSGSINTIRLVTVRSLKDSQIHVLPSILRMGANGSVIDNTSQGGIAVGFDIETGRLNAYGLFKPQFGRRVSSHPNSRLMFSDITIPFIKEVKKQAVFFHSMLKNIHSIGWDIAIGEDGPIFIEGNDDWEITGPQSCHGGLREEFNEFFFE